MPTYKIQCLPYYDTFTQQYSDVFTINKMPLGPLASHIQKRTTPKLSPFQSPFIHSNCSFYIYENQYSNPLPSENIDWLIDFLLSNNYTILDKLTNMLSRNELTSKKQFFITYQI